jgi:hypothetical protein
LITGQACNSGLEPSCCWFHPKAIQGESMPQALLQALLLPERRPQSLQ